MSGLNNSLQKGFSLLEIIIVIAIIALLLTSLPATFNFRTQVDKGYDTTRIHDLTKLSTVMEEFYADHQRYPIAGELCHNDPSELGSHCDVSMPCCNICGKEETPDAIASYISNLPCDPQYSTKDYLYQVPSGESPQWYKIYSKLSLPTTNASPPSCSDGCGPTNIYNLGVSSANRALE